MTLVNHFFKYGMTSVGDVLMYTGITLLFTFFLMNYFKRRKIAAQLDKIPGPPIKIFFGNVLDLVVPPKEMFEYLNETLGSYGKSMCRFWMFREPYVVLHKAAAVEVILSSQKHIEKGRDYDYLLPWLERGLLTSNGAKWHSRRKMLTPAFHFKILEDFIDVFNDQSKKFVIKLEPKANGDFFDVFHYVSKCTLDIILETAMGAKLNVQDDEESEYVKAVQTMGSLALLRATRPWLRSNLLYKLAGYQKQEDEVLNVLHPFTDKIINDKRRNYRKKENSVLKDYVPGMKRRLAFMDLLVEKAEEEHVLTTNDIREEVNTFVFEGHDTTAAAINFSMFLLGCHPDIQEKVYEEQDSIFMGSDRPATADDLKNMKFLECCVKEALRLFPSVPFIERILHEEVEIDGYKIPAGTTALMLPYQIHRDPEQFPDSRKFIPERFLPENSTKRNPYAYIPFSAGPRNCIGQRFALMEEKTVLSYVLRRYRIESRENLQTLSVVGSIIIRPDNGIFIKLNPRN